MMPHSYPGIVIEGEGVENELGELQPKKIGRMQ